jgi:hypothetical protein
MLLRELRKRTVEEGQQHQQHGQQPSGDAAGAAARLTALDAAVEKLCRVLEFANQAVADKQGEQATAVFLSRFVVANHRRRGCPHG